jgi:hypothetical protein
MANRFRVGWDWRKCELPLDGTGIGNKNRITGGVLQMSPFGTTMY